MVLSLDGDKIKFQKNNPNYKLDVFFVWLVSNWILYYFEI